MTPADRTRLRAIAQAAVETQDYCATDSKRFRDEITPHDVLALLSALDAADAVAKAAREILENEPSYAGGWLSDALDEYDAATKETP